MEPDEDNDTFSLLEQQRRKTSSAAASHFAVYVAFLFPALAGFLFGFDIGATSGAVESLLGALDGDLRHSSPLLVGTLTSSSLFGAFAGTMVVFVVGEALGRRRELLVGAACYMAGTALTCVAPSSSDAAAVLPAVLGGRAVYGLGIAFSMHAAPVYISEIAPSEIRGLLVSAKEALIVLGIMMGFATSAASLRPAAGLDGAAWRAIWAPPLVVAAVVLIGVWRSPPSPRWLALRAARRRRAAGGGTLDTSDAAAALTELRRGEPRYAIERELAEIVATLAEGDGGGGGCGEVLRARRALVAGIGLVLLQQLTGQPSVLYYQTIIFTDAGFGDWAPYASVIVGAAKLVATCVAVLIVDRCGRRPLLFAGISMMLAALLALAAAFLAATVGADGAVSLPGGWPTVVVGALMLYVCGYQVGFGPVAWLMISEVFPLRTRTRALSVAVLVNFGSNLLCTFTLQGLQDAFDALAPGRGIAYLFVLYAALCAVSLGFVQQCVPETKGKTLEEIEAMLSG